MSVLSYCEKQGTFNRKLALWILSKSKRAITGSTELHALPNTCLFNTDSQRTDRKADDTNILHPTLFTSQKYSQGRECHKDISFFRQLQKVEWRKIQARVGIAGVHPSPATKECSHHFMQTPSIYRTNYEHKSSRRCWNLSKRGVKEVRPGMVEPDDYVTSRKLKTQAWRMTLQTTDE